jgi:hypothetical protein
MPPRLNTAVFVQRAIAVHGKKYSYSRTVYRYALEKVEIVCRKHGPFWQTPNSHVDGKGCVECGRDSQAEKSRYSQHEVAEHFKQHGCRLLSPYRNGKSPLKYICQCGRRKTTTWNSFSAGHRCRACGIEKAAASNLKKQDDVAAIFDAARCHLLGDYQGIDAPLRFRCSCGHIDAVTLIEFRNRKRGKCENCKFQKSVTIERIRNAVEGQNAVLLSSRYVRGKSLKIRCNCGEECFRSWDTIRKNCAQCDRCAGIHRPSQRDVEKVFADAGCRLLSEYKNAHGSMRYVCSCGRKTTTSLHSFRNSPSCSSCGRDRAAEKQRLTYKDVKAAFAEQGLVLLDEDYRNAYHRMNYICNCGRPAKINWMQFRSGKRCRTCGHTKNRRTGEQHYKWNPDRDYVRLRKSISQRSNSLLRRCFALLGRKKTARSEFVLGYTRNELYSRITNHPNWEEVSQSEWHIDHIFPVKAFIDLGIKDLRVINDLTNLQPLPVLDNILKSDTYSRSQFLRYLRRRHGEDWVRANVAPT